LSGSAGNRASRKAIRLVAATMECSCVAVIHAMLASYLDARPELRRLVDQADRGVGGATNSDPANAAKAGRTIPASALAELEADEDEDEDDADV
jgi:hypothetical protein